jgi:hypothetical protein
MPPSGSAGFGARGGGGSGGGSAGSSGRSSPVASKPPAGGASHAGCTTSSRCGSIDRKPVHVHAPRWAAGSDWSPLAAVAAAAAGGAAGQRGSKGTGVFIPPSMISKP